MVAILGAAGAIGHSAAAELARRGIPYRVIGRDRTRLAAAFSQPAEVFPADIADVDQTARALAGIETVVYTAGLPYPQHHLHPVLFRKALEAARRAAVSRMVLISSVYGYGIPQTNRVAETHPREPNTRKGRYRKEQEDAALAADGEGGLRTLVLRLPDFYGPHAELSLADQVFQGALKNQTANWIGPADKPHEFVFVPDVGPIVLDLLERMDSCFGQAWNFGGPGTITGKEFIAAVYKLAGHEPKFRTVGPMMLRLGGLFDPLLRELLEMHYLATTPVILDDSKLQRFLAVHKTPYSEGIRTTWEWYKTAKG
jgi:nucleoside-diphosphate-sugar epimerase